MSRDLQARMASIAIRIITGLALICMFVYVQHKDAADDQAAHQVAK